MSAVEPLDLEQIDPPIWRVLVSDAAYGPYTLGQLRAFILSGRMDAKSRIAKGDGARFIAAVECSKLSTIFSELERQKQERASSNFVVIAQLEDDENRFIEALNELGSFCEAMPGVYLLRSSTKIAEIQNRLAPACSDEKIMIIDATNDRLAWLGLQSEVSTHLKKIWNKAA